MPGAGAGIGKVQRSNKALHLTGRAARRGYVTDHGDCTFSITEEGMIPEITPLSNMVTTTGNHATVSGGCNVTVTTICGHQ